MIIALMFHEVITIIVPNAARVPSSSTDTEIEKISSKNLKNENKVLVTFPVYGHIPF